MAHFYRIAMAGPVQIMSARSLMRIALFGTASRFSLLALQELAAHRLVAAVVLPQPNLPRWRASLLRIAGIRRLSQLERAAREQEIPVILATNSNHSMVADRLRMRAGNLCGPRTLGAVVA